MQEGCGEAVVMGFISLVFNHPRGTIVCAPFVVKGKKEGKERSVHPGLS